MLHLYFGTDSVLIREKALATATTLAGEGARVTRIESPQYERGMLASLLGATSLFGEREVYVIDTPSADTDFYTEVVAHSAEMGESRNTFIIIEEALLAAERKKFEKYASVVVEEKKVAGVRFDVFKMAEALCNRDKKSLWVLLTEAKREGLSAEEIIGTLWWQLKSLRLAAVTNTAAEAEMKDYPYNKAKRAVAGFKPGELESLSLGLLQVYHDGHGGIRNIDEGLEEWVLKSLK
jgi:DNA polymerase III delta subunit